VTVIKPRNCVFNKEPGRGNRSTTNEDTDTEHVKEKTTTGWGTRLLQRDMTGVTTDETQLGQTWQT